MPNDKPIIPTAKREAVRQIIQNHWKPTPIDPPQADPDVEKLTGPERSAEVIRHSILSLEFWLSPLGRLREWIRLNGKVSAVLFVPAILILPIITWIISQIAHWLTLLAGISGNVLVTLFGVVAITITILLLRAIFGR